jgi:16S rRNA (adenine1518-N6/adenine1519-N6)-dimethyltransferase
LGIKPLKRFGQNFLTSELSAREIAGLIAREANGLEVMEIGPGAGALTRPLLDMGLTVTAIEIDRTLSDYLGTWPEAVEGRLRVIKGDALTFKRGDLPEGPFLVCGCLPYNISTPLLFWFMDVFDSDYSGVFVLQKEFAQRMAASPGGKEYGRLTVAVRNRFKVRAGSVLPPGLFYPAPLVESLVVTLNPSPGAPEVDSKALARMTGICFFSRRKTIFNNLKAAYQPERIRKVLSELGVDEQARPETLAPELYAKLTLAFA